LLLTTVSSSGHSGAFARTDHERNTLPASKSVEQFMRRVLVNSDVNDEQTAAEMNAVCAPVS
jgi:hypothetical protein